MKKQLANWLRKLADRLDWEGAPKRLSWSFTLEEGFGAVFNQDGRGCPLWHYGNQDYDLAHTQSGRLGKPDEIEWVTVGSRTPDGVHVLGSARVLSGTMTRRTHGYLEGKMPGVKRLARIPRWRVTLTCELDSLVSLPGSTYQEAVQRMFGRAGIDA